jgi:hypothetical protein
VALILERNPTIDLATLENALFSTAKDLGTPGRDSMFGYGLVDPYRALNALEAKVAVGRGLPANGKSADAKPSDAKPSDTKSSAVPVTVATTSDKLPLGAASLVSGAPAAPIGPAATPLPTPKPNPTTGNETTGNTTPGRLTVSQLAPPSPHPPAPSPLALRPLAPGPAAQGSVAPAPVALTPPRLESDEAATVERKRQSCRQDAATKGMRGPDLWDYVTLCVSEARLTCLKQAVAQKVRGPERRDFMNRCLLGS